MKNKNKFAGFSSLEELVAAYERLLEEQKAWAGAEKTAQGELFKAEKEGLKGAKIAAEQAHEPAAKEEESALEPAIERKELAAESEQMSEKAPVQRGDKRHEIEEQVRAFFARYPSAAWLKDKMREEFRSRSLSRRAAALLGDSLGQGRGKELRRARGLDERGGLCPRFRHEKRKGQGADDRGLPDGHCGQYAARHHQGARENDSRRADKAGERERSRQTYRAYAQRKEDLIW